VCAASLALERVIHGPHAFHVIGNSGEGLHLQRWTAAPANLCIPSAAPACDLQFSPLRPFSYLGNTPSGSRTPNRLPIRERGIRIRHPRGQQPQYRTQQGGRQSHMCWGINSAWRHPGPQLGGLLSWRRADAAAGARVAAQGGQSVLRRSSNHGLLLSADMRLYREWLTLLCI